MFAPLVFAVYVLCYEIWLPLAIAWLAIRLVALLLSARCKQLLRLVSNLGLSLLPPVIAVGVAIALFGAFAVVGRDRFATFGPAIGQSLLVLWSLQRLAKARHRVGWVVGSTCVGLVVVLAILAGNFASEHRDGFSSSFNRLVYVAFCAQVGGFFAHAYLHCRKGNPWLSPLPDP